MSRWDLSSIPWNIFDAQKVNADLVILAKTASVVEFNSADYVQYLCNVFEGDEQIKKGLHHWGEEERRHGLALARWAKLADPGFDFEKSLQRFRDAFRVPVEAKESIRGSRSAELVARCMVESGTTSYYSSLGDLSEEPVFEHICRWIATDETHHYKFFYTHLQKYLKVDPMSVWERIGVLLSRGLEVNDDELLFAYAATNLHGDIRAADKALYAREYLGRVLPSYSLKNMRKGIELVCRAAGFENSPRLVEVVSRLVFASFQLKAKNLNRRRPAEAGYLNPVAV